MHVDTCRQRTEGGGTRTRQFHRHKVCWGESTSPRWREEKHFQPENDETAFFLAITNVQMLMKPETHVHVVKMLVLDGNWHKKIFLNANAHIDVILVTSRVEVVCGLLVQSGD